MPIISLKPTQGQKFRCNCCRKLILWANLHKHMLKHEKEGEVTIEERHTPKGIIFSYTFNIIRKRVPSE